MRDRLHLLALLFLMGCPSSAETPKEAPGGTGGSAPASAPPPRAFFDEVVYTTVQPTYKVEDEELGTRAAGVQLARMTISEATSLQPLNRHWKLDMQGILQVARNTQEQDETLLAALKELSPHVGILKEYTDPRQRWTSTLPSQGMGPPELWVECTGWETIRGRKRSIPEGCDGVWELGAENWHKVRTYAIQLVQTRHPVASVQGKPLTWGGLMDIAEFVKERPNMCWLESGPTTNYFFGLKTDRSNVCKHMPATLIEKSKALSAEIARGVARRRARER